MQFVRCLRRCFNEKFISLLVCLLWEYKYVYVCACVCSATFHRRWKKRKQFNFEWEKFGKRTEEKAHTEKERNDDNTNNNWFTWKNYQVCESDVQYKSISHGVSIGITTSNIRNTGHILVSDNFSLEIEKTWHTERQGTRDKDRARESQRE